MATSSSPVLGSPVRLVVLGGAVDPNYTDHLRPGGMSVTVDAATLTVTRLERRP